MARNSSVLAWKIPRTGGAWRAAVHGVTKSQMQLSKHTHTHTHTHTPQVRGGHRSEEQSENTTSYHFLKKKTWKFKMEFWRRMHLNINSVILSEVHLLCESPSWKWGKARPLIKQLWFWWALFLCPAPTPRLFPFFPPEAALTAHHLLCGWWWRWWEHPNQKSLSGEYVPHGYLTVMGISEKVIVSFHRDEWSTQQGVPIAPNTFKNDSC